MIYYGTKDAHHIPLDATIDVLAGITVHRSTSRDDENASVVFHPWLQGSSDPLTEFLSSAYSVVLRVIRRLSMAFPTSVLAVITWLGLQLTAAPRP